MGQIINSLKFPLFFFVRKQRKYNLNPYLRYRALALSHTSALIPIAILTPINFHGVFAYLRTCREKLGRNWNQILSGPLQFPSVEEQLWNLSFLGSDGWSRQEIIDPAAMYFSFLRSKDQFPLGKLRLKFVL